MTGPPRQAVHFPELIHKDHDQHRQASENVDRSDSCRSGNRNLAITRLNLRVIVGRQLFWGNHDASAVSLRQFHPYLINAQTSRVGHTLALANAPISRIVVTKSTVRMMLHDSTGYVNSRFAEITVLHKLL